MPPTSRICPDWLHELVLHHVCPATHKATTPWEIEAVKSMEAFALQVLDRAVITPSEGHSRISATAGVALGTICAGDVRFNAPASEKQTQFVPVADYDGPMDGKFGKVTLPMQEVTPASSALPQEGGEWTYNAKDMQLYSSKFEHDAALFLTGDFSSDEQMTAYAESLCRKLNAIPSAKLPCICPTCGDTIVRSSTPGASAK